MSDDRLADVDTSWAADGYLPNGDVVLTHDATGAQCEAKPDQWERVLALLNRSDLIARCEQLERENEGQQAQIDSYKEIIDEFEETRLIDRDAAYERAAKECDDRCERVLSRHHSPAPGVTRGINPYPCGKCPACSAASAIRSLINDRSATEDAST